VIALAWVGRLTRPRAVIGAFLLVIGLLCVIRGALDV